jgi:hypothetical protein
MCECVSEREIGDEVVLCPSGPFWFVSRSVRLAALKVSAPASSRALCRSHSHSLLTSSSIPSPRHLLTCYLGSDLFSSGGKRGAKRAGKRYESSAITAAPSWGRRYHFIIPCPHDRPSRRRGHDAWRSDPDTMPVYPYIYIYDEIHLPISCLSFLPSF